MKRKIILLVTAVFFMLIYAVPGAYGFSGNQSGYRVEGVLGLASGNGINSGIKLNFSAQSSPVGRGNGTGIEGCIGYVCPTKPYVNFIGVTPQSPTTTSILDCGFNVTDTDFLNTLLGNVTWYKNNGSGFFSWADDDENDISIAINTVSNTTSAGDIEANDTVKNDQWKCSIMATDSFYDSLRFNSTAVSILNTQLIIGDIKTFLGTTETSQFERGDALISRVNVTDDDNASDIDQVLITITDPDSGITVNNNSMVNATAITNGYEFIYNYGISGSAPNGTWTIDVFGNDTNNAQDSGSTTFIIVIIEPSIQFILKLNDTANSTVYIPGVGNIAASSITTTEYLNPPQYFLSSENSNKLRSVVFSDRNPVSLIIDKSGVDHLLEIDQKLTNSKIFLVFTLGQADNVANRMELVESGQFLEKISPTFGYGLGDKFPIKIIMGYDDINIEGSGLILQKGVHDIVLQSNKTGTTKKISITREQP